MNNEGFTLIEVILVIAILGILASILIPKVSSYQNTAKIAAHNANVRMIKSAALIYQIENPNISKITMDNLAPYLEKDIDKIKAYNDSEYSIELEDGEIKVIPEEVESADEIDKKVEG